LRSLVASHIEVLKRAQEDFAANPNLAKHQNFAKTLNVIMKSAELLFAAEAAPQKPARASERKHSAAGPLIAIDSGRQPQWMARSVEAFAKEGFAGNAVGYRCVRMTAEAAASVPWLLYEGARELEDHPLLALLRRPNPAEDGQSWAEALYGHLLVTGNAYVECVCLEERPRELYVLRSDRMKLVPGRNGWPEAFDYTAGGSTIRFRQDTNARHLGRRLCSGLRRFQARLSHRRSSGRAHPARSLHRQALCALLHDQARRRRRAEFRGAEAPQIRRGVATFPTSSFHFSLVTPTKVGVQLWSLRSEAGFRLSPE
jgi:hypothetical protein